MIRKALLFSHIFAEYAKMFFSVVLLASFTVHIYAEFSSEVFVPLYYGAPFITF
jgi:hypothetical protein